MSRQGGRLVVEVVTAELLMAHQSAPVVEMAWRRIAETMAKTMMPAKVNELEKSKREGQTSHKRAERQNWCPNLRKAGKNTDCHGAFLDTSRLPQQQV